MNSLLYYPVLRFMRERSSTRFDEGTRLEERLGEENLEAESNKIELSLSNFYIESEICVGIDGKYDFKASFMLVFREQ